MGSCRRWRCGTGREGHEFCFRGEMVKAGEGFHTLCSGKMKIQQRYFHFSRERVLRAHSAFTISPTRLVVECRSGGSVDPRNRFTISQNLGPPGDDGGAGDRWGQTRRLTKWLLNAAELTRATVTNM